MHAHRLQPRRARGFSLLEVIAAIAILAIAFAALMQVAGSSMSLTARANERTQAALRARSLLDGAFIVDPVQEGSSEGRFDDTYRWRLNVAPFEVGDPSPDNPGASSRMVRLDLDVLWGDDGHERRAHFSTLRLVGAQGNPP
ncbi:prepilin-type N-terminal cleavage/methylation domain-containing protein [Luteibacter pinisoli]|jgi:general secretion pathway protein I|uniref:Prepilin-type N-terminal cleavage/methylation domain-containing protein n=1 Tax=Luteibacter pinisoli TaxID=2589080 RepID=A0A4Y5YYS7_9GAMM|nr:prepilin-type N-terminal cleavage/methylation domain-containing protein [Luteibacter pinisoli]QDE38091.1 prepilin-type N-terminal cleavage/methylation domain-containing protein [Luteibacter pinisoli]